MIDKAMGDMKRFLPSTVHELYHNYLTELGNWFSSHFSKKSFRCFFFFSHTIINIAGLFEVPIKTRLSFEV